MFTWSVYVCAHVLYVHACVEHIVDTHTFRFCTAKFHTHQFTKVVLEQFHNIVTNVANSYRLPPGPTERERERKAGRKEGKEGGRKQHINAMTLAVLLGHCARMSMNEMT